MLKSLFFLRNSSINCDCSLTGNGSVHLPNFLSLSIIIMSESDPWTWDGIKLPKLGFGVLLMFLTVFSNIGTQFEVWFERSARYNLLLIKPMDTSTCEQC